MHTFTFVLDWLSDSHISQDTSPLLVVAEGTDINEALAEADIAAVPIVRRHLHHRVNDVFGREASIVVVFSGDVSGSLDYPAYVIDARPQFPTHNFVGDDGAPTPMPMRL